MDALDGNAIAGLLYDVFGHEMTTVVGVCAQCGARHQFAEERVYMRGPGTVARCKTCDAVTTVIVEIREVYCVDLSGLADIEASV